MTNQSKNGHRSMFPVGLKVIAYVLSFLMVLYAIPSSVYAEIVDAVDSALDGTSDTVDALGSADSETPADKAIFEVIDRREETVKHFRDTDGSYVAAQYNYPVHELDASGEWRDIDNTLAESGSEYATPNARVKFAKQITGSETLFTLHDGNRKITMNMSGANKKVAGQVANTHTEFGEEATELQKMMALDKLSSRILYPEILKDVDLEYIVQPDSIKENIIVKEKGDEYRYSFEISLNNLTATLEEDGSVCIANPDTNEVVYVIPAGYMFDGAGEYSDAVQYALADNGSGKYTLTVTADAEWINADERVFPVTIDPTINYNNYDYSSVVQAGEVSSNSPDTAFIGSTSLYAGYISSLGYYYSYVQMTTLPSIPDNATITNATLQMQSFGLQDKVIPVGVYYVVTAWDRSTLTYSNRPTTHSNPVDYEGVEDTGTYNWDVTTLMRNWYDGTYENHGVMIATVNSTDTRVAFHNSNSPTSATSAPLFIITYKDTKGIESYYSYYSSSADLAGEGRINALTGNLAFVHSSIPTTDEILPYTVSLVYNSGLSNQFYTNTSDAIIPIVNKTIGKGFKMSYDETIKTLTTVKSQKMYVWADSDGTEHYFTPENYNEKEERYCNEDGIGVYLYLESKHGLGSGYQIRDDAGNIKHFNSGGYLDYILDISGNKRTFNRNSNNQVTSITLTPKGSSTITQIQMAFSSGMLTTITNQQTGLSARMYYSSTYNGAVSQTPSNFLRKIVYTYATGSTYTVSYEYDSSGRLIMAKDLKSKMAIFYEYSSKGKVIQVAQYANATETSAISAMTLGKKAIINYGALHSYYVSSKETSDTSDDVTTYYRFDPSGRVVSVHIQDANNLYGASNITYDDSILETQNAISSVLQIETDTVNYLLNPGFEWANSDGVPSNWTISGIADCTGDSNDYRNSKLRMEPTGPYNKSIVSQTFKLKEGTYTASALFERSSHDTVVRSRIYIKDSSGNEVAKSKYILPFGTEATTMNLEEQSSVTFTVSGTDCYNSGWEMEIVTEYIDDLTSYPTDWMLVDSVMLEKSNGASRYSSLENGGFENTTSSISIPSWVLVGAQRSTTTRDGQYAITIPGRVSSQSYAYTTVKFMDHIPYPDATGVKTSTSENYVISGWAKAESAYTGNSYTIDDPDNTKKEPIFALKAVVHYMGMTETETVYIPFNDHCTEWQFATGVVSSKPTGNGDYYRISSIDVYCCYDYNINPAYFDSISVVKYTNCVTNYEYNDHGYVSKVSNLDGTGVNYTYDSTGIDIIGATSTDGNNVEMVYDDNHRLTTEINQNGPNNYTIEYDYDDYGQVLSTTVSSGNFAMLSSSTYSTSQTNFGAVLTSTDPNARISRMFYDSKARLIGICANDNTGLIYTYDSFGRVTKVEEATYNASTGAMQVVSGGSSVSSTYNDNDRGVLSAIETSTTKYEFTYDDFGNITKISADGNTLVTNIYAEKNGNLTDSFYGNQDCVRHIYDNLDRITQMRYNDNTGASAIFKYTYNANGDLSSHTDSINGETHVYTYDAKGNIAQRIVKNTTSNTVKRVEQYTYDRQGRVASVDYSYVNTTDVPTLVHYDYEYDVTGNVTNAKYIGTSTQTAYTYDAFGRLETEVFQNISVSNRYFDRMYLYSTNSGATSNQIEWAMMSSYDGKSYDTYYEYDDVGNIVLIEVTDQNNNIILQYNYHYDDKSQLIREDLYYGSGNSLNRTMVYTYDKAGNILSKKKYAYINPASSVSGTPITYSYGYEDAWGDRLTSYNGKSLTYDEIGNPLTYGTYSYEWKFGRQLASISNSSTGLSVSYQYNDEGIRTVKVVNGIRHEYDVVGGQINREVIRSSSSATSAVMKDIRYYYDASGKPVAIRAFTRTSSSADFTDTIYYLQTNLQGDVVAIYNQSGTKIYEYAYDAWGNIIKSSQVATGGSDAHAVNPFRYRGYYYDTETGFYYLQSRYYNPEWGRFLNADVYVNANGDLLGYNMFAYCSNNPVMGVDPTGYYSWRKFKEDLKGFFVNVGDAIIKSVEVEVRFGPGIEAELMNSTVGYSNDLYIALDDGELSTGFVTSISLPPFEYSARHCTERGERHYYCDDCGRYDRYHTGLDYIKCSNSQHSFVTSIGPLAVDSSENYSISASAGIHCIIGGSVSIGFNISEFFNRLVD